jgi:hypothetical protein
MQAWKARLRTEFEDLNSHASDSVEHLRAMLRSVLSSTKCGKCDVDTLDGDLVRFKCPGSMSDHVLCSDCLGDRIERQRGYLERHPRAEELRRYAALANIVLCHECHCPHVVTCKTVFGTGFTQNQLRTRGRQEYSVDPEMTAIVQEPEMFKVHTYFENQRRGMFSKFSCDNLNFTDTRTATSTECGEPIDLNAVNKLPDSSQIWLEEWTCDTKDGDPQGWSYAVNWPTASFFVWSLSASFTTFVRRRRKMRTLVRLDNRLKRGSSRASESPAAEAREE